MDISVQLLCTLLVTNKGKIVMDHCSLLVVKWGDCLNVSIIKIAKPSHSLRGSKLLFIYIYVMRESQKISLDLVGWLLTLARLLSLQFDIILFFNIYRLKSTWRLYSNTCSPHTRYQVRNPLNHERVASSKVTGPLNANIRNHSMEAVTLI